jgi:predicted nucleic acid-binding protein
VIAFDSNVLLYALMEPTTTKGDAAIELIERGAVLRSIIPAQALGEILAVVRRRRPELLSLALMTLDDFAASFQIAPTDADIVRRAGGLATRHRLQIWDAVICAASLSAGATHLLSEDMNHGHRLAGLTIINPFDPTNRDAIERLLQPVP